MIGSSARSDRSTRFALWYDVRRGTPPPPPGPGPAGDTSKLSRCTASLTSEQCSIAGVTQRPQLPPPFGSRAIRPAAPASWGTRDKDARLGQSQRLCPGRSGPSTVAGAPSTLPCIAVPRACRMVHRRRKRARTCVERGRFTLQPRPDIPTQGGGAVAIVAPWRCGHRCRVGCEELGGQQARMTRYGPSAKLPFDGAEVS
ncbi:hypothetical protein F444_12396 [Phytophthora nicotianae P1976]|uniref:Uncharacterized protein n=1 Tax=Phytophthora nicotianae P1976 TaxID=1317066 RepID=A0A080ZX65_PHYNI|nr:hypothetical protein F444_12396 [Phytophthora nicotianae P1976]